VFHEHETLVICVYSKKFLSLTGKLMTWLFLYWLFLYYVAVRGSIILF
jgi:uncharacterized membrane protein